MILESLLLFGVWLFGLARLVKSQDGMIFRDEILTRGNDIPSPDHNDIPSLGHNDILSLAQDDISSSPKNIPAPAQFPLFQAEPWKQPFDDQPPIILPGHYLDGPIVNQLAVKPPPRGIPLPTEKKPPQDGMETVVKVVVVTEIVDAPPVTVFASEPPEPSPSQTVLPPHKPTKPAVKPTSPAATKPSPSGDSKKPQSPIKKTSALPVTITKTTPTKPSASPKPTKPAQVTNKKPPPKKDTDEDKEGNEDSNSPTSPSSSQRQSSVSKTASAKPTAKIGRRVRGNYPPRRKQKPGMKPFNINDYKSVASKSAFHLPTDGPILTANKHRSSDANPITAIKSTLILSCVIPLFYFVI